MEEIKRLVATVVARDVAIFGEIVGINVVRKG